LFPNIQTIFTADSETPGISGHRSAAQLPPSSEARPALPHWLPTPPIRPKRFPQHRNVFFKTRFNLVSKSDRTILLIDLDSAIPNLALMKLSRYF
jgi:hypothetical protein